MTLVSGDSVHLSQRQLESALWDAANALRGPVDPADFKSDVFPALIFKWISDT
jgi:type I restriction enzyme M protein